MSTPSPEGPADGPPSTLGSLLYGNSVEPPVLEAEWNALVRAIAERQQAALHELFDRTNGIVFTLIFRIIKDPLTAEELTLDVYHDVWRNAARFDPARGSVVAWLMNQARSRAIDALRSQNRKKRTAVPLSEAAGADGAPHSSDADARKQVLERCLQALTVDERRAIEAAYFGEKTYSEAAQHLGEPLGTVKTRIRTGLSKLRTLLAGQEDL
jgi:RNA polymerase sigma-70 factor (ECF subfamily)